MNQTQLPSCHKKAANTARIHSATDGDMASFTTSGAAALSTPNDSDLGL